LLTIESLNNEELLLEMGVSIHDGTLYATYYSNGAEKNLTLNSQLSIKFGIFVLVGLSLIETGGGDGFRMEMGLYVNGVRDESVSVPRTVLLPEGMLTLGHVHLNHDHHHDRIKEKS